MLFWIRTLPLLALMAVLAPIASEEDFPTQHLCGFHLEEAISLVCGEGGYHYTKERRDIEESLANGVEALSFEPRDMKRRDLLEECCVNVCPLDVLESYCD